MSQAVWPPLGIGVLVTLGFMLHAGEPGRPAWWLGFVPFAAWAVSPFVAAGMVASRFRASPLAVRLVAAAAAALAGSSLFVYHQGFVAHPDAQSGLLFLFLPLWQLLAILPVFLAARALARRAGSSRRRPTPGR